MKRVNLTIIVLACFVQFLALAPCNESSAETARGAGVSVETLPDEVKSYDIKDYFISSDSKEAGVIHDLDGTVIVIHGDSGNAYFGVEGDPVYENDTLLTLADSRCRIRFLSEDVVTMASDAHFTVESALYSKEDGKKGSVFRLMKGKAMFYALRLLRYKEARMTLKTPTAVVGVRGTKFGAEVYLADDRRSSSAGVVVADLSSDWAGYLAQIVPQTGAGRIVTDCFSEDGELDVNGKLVRPGEMFRGERNLVMPTPPNYVRSFESQTEIRREEGRPRRDMLGPEGRDEKKGERRDGVGPKPPPPPGMPLPGMGGMLRPLGPLVPFGENLMNIIARQGPRKIEQEGAPLLLATAGKIAGEGSFIAAMILMEDSNDKAFNVSDMDPMYFSRVPNIFNAPDGLESHTAFENAHPDNPKYKMVVDEIDQSMNMRVNYFTLNHLSNKALVVTPHVFQWQQDGGYVDPKGQEYLRWGHWEDTNSPVGYLAYNSAATPPEDEFYAAKARIWEVEGDLTHPDYIDYLHRQNAVFNYAGGANGVFASSATASMVHLLSGGFSCQVNFASKEITNLNVDVSKSGDYRVNLQGGSGLISSNGSFSVNAASFAAGGSTINGNVISSASETGANGAFFGPKAEGVAGTWNANGGGSNQYWATGEFHGKR